MGSRGQALKSGGFTEYKYHTIARYNNVRFIVQNSDWNSHYKLTEMSNSPWTIYAGVDSKGILQTITFYNGNRKKYKEVDLTKPHHGMSPHVYECDPKLSLSLKDKEPRLLTTKEKNKVNKIVDYFIKHNLSKFAINGGKLK